VSSNDADEEEFERDEAEERPEVALEAEREDAPDEGGDAPEEADPEAEVRRWKEVAHRTAADLENFRKRAAREREESLRYANQSLLEELLPVLDNFEMGMQAAAQEEGSMIYVGMEMVRKQLAEFLANSGVREIEAEGKPFDPNLHDAVSQEVAEDVEEGTVLRVARRGYLLRERLLRPASVVVAKSGDGEE